MNVRGLALGTGLALVAIPVWANAGIPLLAVPWSWNLVLLLPVMILEILVLRWRLGVSARDLAGPVGLANFITTGLGHLVVLYGAMFGLSEVLLANAPEGHYQPPGMIWQLVGLLIGNPPSEEMTEAQVKLLFCSGVVVTLVPFFVVSWLLEAVIVAWASRLSLRQLIWSEFLAHVASYAFLLAVVAWVVFSPGAQRFLADVGMFGLTALNIFQNLVDALFRLF